MRAVVYEGNGIKTWSEVPDPKIRDDTDAIVQVDTTTICGTDLHILKGDVPEVTPGRILGHEAVGTVVDTGLAVRDLMPGDRVLLSCISSCGHCINCRAGHYGQCIKGGGWQFGHIIDGVQAEYARVPFADFSCYKLPDDVSNDQAVQLADVLPTGYEVGVLNGHIQPGDTVAVVGAGPIGLSVIMGAQLFSAGRIIAIDPDEGRRKIATDFGADLAIGPSESYEAIRVLTDCYGADVTVEAVGKPETFELCTSLVRPGGRVANVGVHGTPATLHLESLWTSNVTITTGLVDTTSIPALLRLVQHGLVDPGRFATHDFALHSALAAYDTFADASRTGALKVVLHR